MHPALTSVLSTVLSASPRPLQSWLLYLGIQGLLPDKTQDMAPLRNCCEFLNAVHVYADEARREGKARWVEANHFCSHLSKDVRQCLIYDSDAKNARLIGVEYMITREMFAKLDAEEQKLWHSHEYEVKSGMLVLPTPPSHASNPEEWERLETEAMKEVVGLYGKTWHFWQVDRGDELPLGLPRLMGSLTEENQVDLDAVLKDRDERFGVDLAKKQKAREHIKEPGIVGHADSWWRGVDPPPPGFGT